MAVEIVDVHVQGDDGFASATQLHQQCIDGLLLPAGQKTLPTMLLYDQRGLRLYDDITTEAPEYYLFPAEEQILKDSALTIVQAMHRGTQGVIEGEIVLELGSGALRKTSHVLRGLSELVKAPRNDPPITYYALDLELRELERTLGEISTSDIGRSLQGKVSTKGMCGTYDDGLKFIYSGGLDSPSRASRAARPPLKFDSRDASPASESGSFNSSNNVTDSDASPPSTPDVQNPPLHILFLGSSLGNFARDEQAEFLRSLPLRPGSGDTLLLGMDHDNPKGAIEDAYNDRKGITRKFILNGLKVAGRTLGDENMFHEDKWEYVNTYDETARRHAAYYKSKVGQNIDSTGNEFTFLENELIKIEVSYKFSDVDAYTLFAESNLRPVQRWTDSTASYSLWLLERPPFMFPLLKSPRACNAEGQFVAKKFYSSSPFGVPSPQEWNNLWAAWDFITLRMIPPTMLYQKPIDLRHICLFYFGHIPTFLDIHLSRLLEEPHTDPAEFKYIFERGIDPSVDDPSQCHPHSEVPQQDEDWPTLASILQFETKVRARLLRLYEDIDSGKRKLDRKIGRVLFMTFEHEAFHLETLLYMLLQRAGSGTLPPPGFIRPDWDSLAAAWDAEPKPDSPTVTLGPATVALGHDDREADDSIATDVASHEFGWDNEHPKREVSVDQFRIEWRPVTNGQFYEFYKGASNRLDFPASWVEIDGKIHVRTLYGPVPLEVAQHWPVMTTYDNLSSYATVQGGRLPTEPELLLFFDMFESGYEGGANVGFRNWHPIPATANGKRGTASNGGVWEWTSSLFERQDGFDPSTLYPGYSMDFFDGHHQIVIGGSYATIPRIAERRSVRNWYQRNYPYPWVGGRVAYDN